MEDSKTTAEHTEHDPRLIPYLPLIYVAWADGDLSADELKDICSRVQDQEGLDCDCQDLLSRWLDPQNPPSATELQHILGTIRKSAENFSDSERQTLSGLGLQMLEARGQSIQPEERRALQDLEEALGFSGAEATRQILAVERPEPSTETQKAPFDTTVLETLLDGPYRPLRQELRRLLAQPAFAYHYGEAKEAYRERVLRLTQEIGRHGYGALSFPKDHSGGDDTAAFVAVFEMLAYGDMSVVIKFGVQFGLFGGSILQLGTKKHHEKYLPAVGTMELPGCFAMSEAGHGSNVRDVETTATFDPATDHFVIHTPRENSRKDWIGNAAAHGQLATVFAQLRVKEEDYGVHAFLVPIRDEAGATRPGVRIGDCGEKLGLNGVDNGRLWFDHVKVPRENLLDRFAQVDRDGVYTSPIPSPSKRFFTMLGTLVGGRVSIALASLSAAKSGLTIAVRYGQRRRQFGPTGQAETRILDYLSHQRRLLPRLAKTYALHFALRHLENVYVSSPADDRRQVETLAAGLKAYSSWHAVDTLQTCRECCGGQGYLAVNRFSSLKEDTDIFTTFEGDNTVLLQLVAKGLLTGYRRQFGEMNLLGLMRFMANQAATSLAELNPIITRRSDEDHLRSREFQLSALVWREQHLLGSAARRLKKRFDAKMDSHDAFVDVQDHLLKLALAHVERVILEQFVAGLEACQDSELRSALETLCDLFALERLEADRGWFLSQGYLEPGKSKAIRNLVNRLLPEVRAYAVPLVDAFGIPGPVLAAPIALGDLDEPVAQANPAS